MVDENETAFSITKTPFEITMKMQDPVKYICCYAGCQWNTARWRVWQTVMAPMQRDRDISTVYIYLVITMSMDEAEGYYWSDDAESKDQDLQATPG